MWLIAQPNVLSFESTEEYAIDSGQESGREQRQKKKVRENLPIPQHLFAATSK